MKMALFDLGDTLEREDVLLPGARQVLDDIAQLRDDSGDPVILGLGSDFTMPDEETTLAALQQEYYGIIGRLGIDQFFEPLAERVTLSSEVGVFKPDRAFFDAVVAKVGVTFADVLFVTENAAHVRAARHLGLIAVQVRSPGGSGGDISSLAELLPLVHAHIHSP